MMNFKAPKEKKKKPFENVVGKGENAVNQLFTLFALCFLSYPKINCTISAKMKMPSA